MARNFKEVGMRINTSPEQKDSIFKLHAKGLTNRQIAAQVGIHHRTVGDHLRRKKLRPNGTVKQPIEMVDQDTAHCSKCQEVKPIIDKITPAHGYVKSNVVLCVARVNTIKSDVSLGEMKLWMPGWYQRVVYMWRELRLTCFQVAPGDF
jgi:IS30 family transposase